MTKRKYIQYIKGKSEREERKIEQYLEQYEFYDKDAETYLPDDADNVYFPENKSNRILDEIHQRIDEKQSHRKSVLAYAACIIALLISGTFFIYKEKGSPENQLAFQYPQQRIEQRNDTKTNKNVLLPDKSVAVLYPNTSISYLPNFTSKSRDIYLKGTAVFEVSKDPKKPFTVYCGDVATTALGTKFRVSSFAEKTLVELFEGKVLVRNPNTDDKDKQYYLEAGNAIAYNINTNDFTPVMNIETPDNRMTHKIKTVPKKIVATAAKPDLLAFENTPMTDALDKLSDKYNVKIEYSPSDLDHVNIIATISPKQPLSQVLENIASMNHLELIVVSDKEYILHHKSE